MVHRTVRLTDEQTAIAIEKLAVTIVERQRLMAAEIFESHDFPLIVGHKGIYPDTVSLEGKLPGPSLRQIIDIGYFFAHQSFAKTACGKPSLRLPRR